MNVKTTLGLAVALIVLVVAFVVVPDRGPSQDSAATPDANSLEQPLLDPEFGDPVEITVQRRGQPAMRMELVKGEDDLDDRWTITEPFEANATKWMIEGVLRQLKGAKIQLTYKPGDAGAVTVAQADLEDPRQRVTLTNAEGVTVEVSVGKAASDASTYARLGTADEVHVVTPTLKDLLKKELTEYRDLVLFEFDKAEVTRVEVTQAADGDSQRYVLTKTDDKWVFEEPFKARATQRKVTDLINTLSRLRAAKWADDGTTPRSVFGLENPARTVSVTVEHREEPEPDPEDEAKSDEVDSEEVESDEDAEEQDGASDDGEQETAEEPKPEPVITSTVYTLHISDRAPVGDDNKVYIQKAGDTAVATLNKSTGNKFSVKVADWRDMKLINAPVVTANKVTLTNASGTTTFERSGSSWYLADRDENADSAKVRDLLKKLNLLEARAFIDHPESEGDPYGLATPQATIEISMPGQPDLERLDVGAYTDEQTKRMVYVQRQGSSAVAKVRVDDIGALFESAIAFLDRQIFDIPVQNIDEITLLGIEPSTQRPFGIALTRTDDGFGITSPAQMPTDSDRALELAESLANLTAVEVVADGGLDDDYGLLTPNVTAVIRFTVPSPDGGGAEESASEDDEDADDDADEDADADDDANEDADEDDDADEDAEDAPAPSSSESRKLLVADHDGVVYAKRGDRDTVYRIERSVYEQLIAEYHSSELLDFQESQATSVTVTTPAGTTRFEKRDDTWVFTAEADLPIDRKKVESLVAQIRNIKSQRYIAYQAELADFGLDEASRAMTIEVHDEDGSVGAIWIASEGSEHDPDKRVYAALADSQDVFLLPSDVLDRFLIKIEDYEAP
ncbi:MAG: DUF4340 domain-containing protein [Planctomycetes bacterium]|nr:DUF4340 domain-containing protein [Planctomycetota bacterium]